MLLQLRLQALEQWTKEPINTDQQPTYAHAVLLQRMMDNMIEVYWMAHQAIVGCVDGDRGSGSIQKSRTALASGRNFNNGVTTINRPTQCALAQLRRGKV